MGRLPDKEEAKLSLEQRRAYEETKRVRGQVRGPFAIWLRNAELSETALRLQDMFASARMATAQYAWFIHEPHALKLGISPEIIEAIRERRTPEFAREDERAVYDITLELNTTRSLSEANYQRGMALFGEQVMIELVSAIGFYVMVAMTLNAFAVQVPGGKEPLA